MSSHAARRAPRPAPRAGRRRRTSWRRSARLRAVLGLGVIALVGTTGTFAFWTDEVLVSGTTFTAGTLDLKVENQDAYATTTLSMGTMVPGNSAAEVMVVKNGGTAPLKYTMTGGLTGADAAAYGTAGSLKLTIHVGGTRSGSGSAFTCSGGTPIVSSVSLTATPATAIIGTGRGPLASTATESLCFEIALDGAAPSSLQGKTATATFTLTGTSDVS